MRFRISLFVLLILSVSTYGQTFIRQLGSTNVTGTDNGVFDSPNAVAIDSGGNIYVADKNNERIQKFDSDGVFIAKWGSLGSGDGQFGSNNLADLAFDGDGNLWAVDRANSRIQKFDTSGKFLFKFGIAGSADGQFSAPSGIAINAGDTIYIADRNNERIQAFKKDGTFLFKFGSLGVGDGQFASNAGVHDIAIDVEGNIFATDRANDRIQKFSKLGVFLDKFGSTGSGNSQFEDPVGVAIHPNGEIWVSDRSNERVSVWSNGLSYQSYFGSIGTGDDQFASNGGVSDIAFTSTGDAWIVDRNNDRVKLVEGPTVAVIPSSIVVFAKVYLEGAYNGSDLNTLLNASIPTDQPYSINGHSAGETAGSVPAGAVDWVLVELREAASASAALESTRVGSAAGFLMNDGTIKSTDGTSNLTVSLTGNSGADFFVVVYHRNHLSIMSADPISANGSDIYAIDFTTLSANTYQTTTALTTLSTGKFAMSAGDADGDGDVDAADLTAWRAQNGGAFTYNSTNGDFNLDGVINAVDRNGFQQKNNTKTSQVPTT